MSSNYSDSTQARAAAARRQQLIGGAKRRIKLLLGPTVTARVIRSRQSLRYLRAGWSRIQKPMDPRWIDVLDDPAFQASVASVIDLSASDTPRLANLWQWCGQSEDGVIVEVGTFRGGTALHLSNRWPQRKVVACDTFEGFAPLAFHARFDAGFNRASWCNPDAEAVRGLFAARGRHAVVLKGIFPDSDRNGEVHDVSFAHIDTDVYESCRRSLDYLAQRATPSAIFAINDYLRGERGGTTGVRHAVEDFVADNPDWVAIPAFPGQGILLNRATYGMNRAPRQADRR